jgi:hypothetical protein
VVGDGDVIALPLEGLQLLLPLPVLPRRTPPPLLLPLPLPVLRLHQLPRDVQPPQHIWSDTADVGVGVTDVLVQHPVVVLVHLQARTHRWLAARTRSWLATLALNCLLLASLPSSLGSSLRPSRPFLASVLAALGCGQPAGVTLASVLQIGGKAVKLLLLIIVAHFWMMSGLLWLRTETNFWKRRAIWAF